MALKPLDALDMEFQYYRFVHKLSEYLSTPSLIPSCLVKELVLMLPTRCEQSIAAAWCHKLSGALYNVEPLREKRNRYLLMLSICLTLSGLRPPFDKYPIDDALAELELMYPKTLGTEKLLEQGEINESCDLHSTKCPADDDGVAKVLDQQFKFLMNLAQPYVSRLSDPSDRRRARQWVDHLTTINSSCFDMKGVRNDYAMLLSGYLVNDELPGPFLRPPIEKLIPLENLVTIEDMNNKMPIDPSNPRTLKFFRDVPYPEDGAFAFIAVSGEICDSFAKTN